MNVLLISLTWLLKSQEENLRSKNHFWTYLTNFKKVHLLTRRTFRGSWYDMIFSKSTQTEIKVVLSSGISSMESESKRHIKGVVL